MNKFYLLFFILNVFFGFSQTKKDSVAIENLLVKAKKQQDKLKFPDAYKTFNEVLQLTKKSNDKALEFKTEIAIANFHLMKGENNLAKAFFEYKFPSPSFPAEIHLYYYHRKAFYFNQIMLIDSVLVNGNKGLKIAKEIKSTPDLITLYNEIGYAYEHQRKFDSSIEFYDKVLALTKNDLEAYSNTYYNKARVYSIQKKYKESNAMLFDNLNQISNTNWYRTKSYIHQILLYNFQYLGDSTNYYKHMALRDQEHIKVLNAVSEDNYKALLVKHQTKEKDALLSKQETESKKMMYLIVGLFLLFLITIPFYFFIRRKNQKLNKLLSKNNFLLSELNHRTKNNLQLIVSLTTRETNKTNNTEITGLINLASKIESIASLHKQLYLNDELKSVNSRPYIEEIISSIYPFLKQNEIEIDKEIDNVEIDSNQSLYIGLIINELLVNSIKHAFPNKTNKCIQLKFKSEKKHIEIYYTDNGIGIPANARVKLITTLSSQIEADFQIENRNGFCYFAKIKIQLPT